MSDITCHQFMLAPPSGGLVPTEYRQMWQVVCTSQQARRISAEVERLGWTVASLKCTRFMSLEDLAVEFGKLKIVAQITAPSPWDENGEWTSEALQRAREGAIRLYDKDGNLVDPDAAEPTP